MVTRLKRRVLSYICKILGHKKRRLIVHDYCERCKEMFYMF